MGPDPSYFFVKVHLPIGMVIASVIVAAVGFRIMAQGGFIFSLTHVSPSLDKVSPMKGLQRLFKAQSLTEFGATFSRFMTIVVVCGFLIFVWTPTILNTDLCVPSCALPIAWAIIKPLLIATAIMLLVSITFDVIVQKKFFLEEQKMTKTDVKKEQKEMLGTPEVIQERRRLQRDGAAMVGSVGIAAATAYFTYGDRVIALAFDPVKNPLPKIAIKSRKAATTITLIQTLINRGVPGRENEEIVAACEVLPIGSSVPRGIFMPVASNLRQMMS